MMTSEAFPHSSVRLSPTTALGVTAGLYSGYCTVEDSTMVSLPDLHLAGAKKHGQNLVILGQSSSWGTFSPYSRDSPGLGGWLLLLILLPRTQEARRFAST